MSRTGGTAEEHLLFCQVFVNRTPSMVDHKKIVFPLIFSQFLPGGAEAWIVDREARGRSQEIRLSCSVPVGNYIHCLESTNWRIYISLHPLTGITQFIFNCPSPFYGEHPFVLSMFHIFFCRMTLMTCRCYP